MIDADKLIAAINERRCADCSDKEHSHGCAACQWDDAIRMIESAPTIGSALGSWISMEDKTPTNKGMVCFVWCPGFQTPAIDLWEGDAGKEIRKFPDDGTVWISSGWRNNWNTPITHWTPMKIPMHFPAPVNLPNTPVVVNHPQEQESVAPEEVTILDKNLLLCGACNAQIDMGDRYCRECGRKVKWNETDRC